MPMLGPWDSKNYIQCNVSPPIKKGTNIEVNHHKGVNNNKNYSTCGPPRISNIKNNNYGRNQLWNMKEL